MREEGLSRLYKLLFCRVRNFRLDRVPFETRKSSNLHWSSSNLPPLPGFAQEDGRRSETDDRVVAVFVPRRLLSAFQWYKLRQSAHLSLNTSHLELESTQGLQVYSV